MRTIILTAIIMISGSIKADAQHKLSADTGKTRLEWLGEKVTGQHNGTIQLEDGWLEWNNNRIVSGIFNIDMTTIKDTDGSEKLEGHLKSDDFFGVDKYPASRLVITGSDDFQKGTATVRGNLTIKGITNPIEFKTTVQKKDDGNWFYANIVVDRSKYNVRYGSGSFFDNLGDKIIYDEFKLKISLLVK